MQSVLIDACGWAACIDAKLNIQNEMESLLGPCEWLVIPKVLEELVDLEQQRPAGKGLLLDLLRSKSTLIGAEHIGHTDDLLVKFAKEHQAATLTVDTELKRRLFEANLRVLEVKQSKYLHLVDLL
ncbi:MAG: hypothetical protein L7U25_04160 [Candidatus Poseidonia sp.]|nr:hypothetical protein [Poseidonia sp.]